MSNSNSDDHDAPSVFEREQSGDVMHHEFGDARVGFGTDPVDGLPKPVFEGDSIGRPPLTIDTFICLADEREYVIRNRWGEVLASFTPEEVTRTPSGATCVTLKLVRDKMSKEEFDQFGRIVDEVDENYRVPVVPVRERCRLLVEQMVGFEGGNEHVRINRFCSLRHDNDGDLLSLSDDMVIACMGRDPADFVSEDRLRKMNAKIIKAGAARAAAGGVYDLSKLDQEDEYGGIFK